MKKIARIEPCFDANLMQAKTGQNVVKLKGFSQKKQNSPGLPLNQE
jgi:hypothetical protein